MHIKYQCAVCTINRSDEYDMCPIQNQLRCNNFYVVSRFYFIFITYFIQWNFGKVKNQIYENYYDFGNFYFNFMFDQIKQKNFWFVYINIF